MPRTPNALDLLRQDHRKVLTLFHRFEKTEDENEQRELCDEIIDELTTHTSIEEGVVYPFLREATAREDLFEEANIEHQTAKDLLERLQEEQPGTARFQAMVKVLGEYVEHHVKEEEGEIFPQIEKTGVDLEALGQELQERRSGGAVPKGGGAAKASAGTSEGMQASSATSPASARDTNGEADEDETFLAEHGDELSASTQRAKWIHSADEHADHDGQTLATRNPEVIQAWAEARGARPATTPGGDAERPRVLRFDFPDYDKGLQEVTWEAWLRTFDERELVFVYQENMKAGNQSNFFRLDSPHREEG